MAQNQSALLLLKNNHLNKGESYKRLPGDKPGGFFMGCYGVGS